MPAVLGLDTAASHDNGAESARRDSEAIFDAGSLAIPVHALATYRSLVFLNVPSYAAGLPLWSFARQRKEHYYASLAVQRDRAPASKAWCLPPANSADCAALGSAHSMNDGALAMVGVRSMAAVAPCVAARLPAMFGGVHQLAVTDAVQLRFDAAQCTAPLHMQIDGEAYVLSKPSTVSMSWLGKAHLSRNRLSSAFQ